MSLAAQIVFWASAAALFYTYVGYPLLVWLIAVARPLAILKNEIEPRVSVIITAFNEEKDLRRKLENTLALDYPAEKLEIIVASDASTDATDDIAREFAAHGVRLFRQDDRAGKTATQNGAVEVAIGEILIFSDATSLYQPDVLRCLLPNFADESIGGVAGKLVYVNRRNSTIGDGARSYWNYETFLKRAESRACSLIGASGSLYAVRRAAYAPMYVEACGDFLIAIKLREQNLRTIFEETAVAVEETNHQPEEELKMRVRVVLQTFYDLWRHRQMLNPLRAGFFAVELLSHKIFRYGVPLFLILLLLSSGTLAFSSTVFAAIFAVQILFYALALVAWAFERCGFSSKLLSLPVYFALSNVAVVVAFYKFVRGERIAMWQPIRDAAPPPPPQTAHSSPHESLQQQ